MNNYIQEFYNWLDENPDTSKVPMDVVPTSWMYYSVLQLRTKFPEQTKELTDKQVWRLILKEIPFKLNKAELPISNTDYKQQLARDCI